MAYRLRRRTRRTTLRRRRPMRRRPMMRRRPRLASLKVHHFKRTVQLANINATAAPAQFIGYSFNLNQLPNATEFTNLFDCYRMNKVVLKFVPNRSSSDFSTAAPIIPNFHSVIDNTDATAPTSLNELYEYANWRMTRGNAIHTRILTPASLDVVATSAGTASANPTYKQWISTSSPTVEHYGLKIGAEGTTAGAVTWLVFATYYFSCKSTK